MLGFRCSLIIPCATQSNFHINQSFLIEKSVCEVSYRDSDVVSPVKCYYTHSPSGSKYRAWLSARLNPLHFTFSGNSSQLQKRKEQLQPCDFLMGSSTVHCRKKTPLKHKGKSCVTTVCIEERINLHFIDLLQCDRTIQAHCGIIMLFHPLAKEDTLHTFPPYMENCCLAFCANHTQ